MTLDGPKRQLPVRPALRTCASYGAVFVACIVLSAVLVWPLPLHLEEGRPVSSFGDSHVWVFDHLFRVWMGQEDAGLTCRAGYPALLSVRAIGQVPALWAAMLRPFLGPLGAANVIQVVSLPLSGLAMALALRRFTRASRAVCGLLAVCWAFSPTLLGTYATQEVSNTQAWILPLYLWVAGQPGSRAFFLTAGVSVAAAFTSPYYALALPFLWGAYALTEVSVKRGGVWRVLGLGVCTAGGLAPAANYYEPGLSGGSQSVFQPARRLEDLVATVPEPPPVADPLRLVWAETPAELASGPVHVVYLGLALVAATLVVAVMQRRCHRLGVVTAVAGLTLCVGPFLSWDGSYQLLGQWFRLPVWWLEWAGYPTALGGMYYRYAVIVSLGLVLILADGMDRLRHAWVLALFLVGLQLVDGLRSTGLAWPRPMASVEDAELFRMLRSTDASGAVLTLPWQESGDADAGQQGMLEAALHGRPTTMVPRDPARLWRPLRFLAQDLESREHPDASLRRWGVRFVYLRNAATSPRLEALSAALGTPVRVGKGALWDAGATSRRCREVPEKRTKSAPRAVSRPQ